MHTGTDCHSKIGCRAPDPHSRSLPTTPRSHGSQHVTYRLLKHGRCRKGTREDGRALLVYSTSPRSRLNLRRTQVLYVLSYLPSIAGTLLLCVYSTYMYAQLTLSDRHPLRPPIYRRDAPFIIVLHTEYIARSLYPRQPRNFCLFLEPVLRTLIKD